MTKPTTAEMLAMFDRAWPDDGDTPVCSLCPHMAGVCKYPLKSKDWPCLKARKAVRALIERAGAVDALIGEARIVVRGGAVERLAIALKSLAEGENAGKGRKGPN